MEEKSERNQGDKFVAGFRAEPRSGTVSQNILLQVDKREEVSVNKLSCHM